MKHKIKQKKLNRTSSHRQAMLSNIATSLILHEQIKTTLPKAKILQPFVEKLITKSLYSSLSSRRYLLSRLKNNIATKKLLLIIGPRYIKRCGGYTQIIKIGHRHGDMAPICYIQLVNRDTKEKIHYNSNQITTQ